MLDLMEVLLVLIGGVNVIIIDWWLRSHLELLQHFCLFKTRFTEYTQ
jgi:hypothetical protein